MNQARDVSSSVPCFPSTITNIAVKAVHVTPAQRAQKRNVARMWHSNKLRHVGAKLWFSASELRRIEAKRRL
jgi:hypothetical protein